MFKRIFVLAATSLLAACAWAQPSNPQVRDSATDPTGVSCTAAAPILRYKAGGTSKMYSCTGSNGTVYEAMGGGGGTPGGADTQVQYNDSGVFGADAYFTWNKSTHTAQIGTGSAPATTTITGAGITTPTLAASAGVSAPVVNTNGWAINTSICLYAEGASITRAPHTGGNPIGAQLAGGGLAGNYSYLLSTSFWGNGHAIYFNDGIDGSTSTQMLARYTVGNSTYGGITVPAAHTACAATIAAGGRAFLLLGMDEVNNDQNNSIAIGTTVSNLQAEVAAAQADGYIVVLLTAPSQNFTASNTANIDALNGTISSGNGTFPFVVDMQKWIADPADTNYWDTSGPHPNVNGHKVIAANLLGCMIAGGCQNQYDQTTYTSPVVVVQPNNAGRTIIGTDGSLTLPGPLKLNGGTMTNQPLMVWSGTGTCSPQYAYCTNSAQWTPSSPITITKFTIYASTAPAGCTNAGSFVINLNSFGSILSTINFVNGTSAYTNSGLSINVGTGGGPLAIATGTVAATGCSPYANTINWTVEYKMQ